MDILKQNIYSNYKQVTQTSTVKLFHSIFSVSISIVKDIFMIYELLFFINLQLFKLNIINSYLCKINNDDSLLYI